jgi:TetR/AcrR family transcriptional regulator, repressor for neighboring sulfatase
MPRGTGGQGERRVPGPRRAPGLPTGPEDVRRATIAAAAELFTERGVDGVSLRDVAVAANVQLALIGRYIGTRDDLIQAVFADLSAAVAKELVDRPLTKLSLERDSAMGRWAMVLTHLVTTHDDVGQAVTSVNPVLAVAQVLEEAYGLDGRSARLRAAQIAALALGWRVFEPYLVAAAQLEAVPREVLHDELLATHLAIGSTEWITARDRPRDGAAQLSPGVQPGPRARKGRRRRG